MAERNAFLEKEVRLRSDGDMDGTQVGVYNGKSYVGVEIKAEMVGTYLAEYSITYKPIKHGRPGIGATASSKFVPLK